MTDKIAQLRANAEKAKRLASSVTDELTRQKLSAYGQECTAEADRLERLERDLKA